VRLLDVNGDGRLDALVRPGKVEYAVDLSKTTPGQTGVFLQEGDGTFAEARTLAPAGWLPADTDTKTQPLGFDIRDLDGDRVLDLLLERNGVGEGLFRQEHGWFATTPDFETQSLFPDLVAAARHFITVEFAPSDAALASIGGYFNRLSYVLADMDGDGRQDIVAAYAPFAPNLAPDPATGKYPYPGFLPNTYTELRVHRQRALARKFLVEVTRADVSGDEPVLHLQATVRNLADAAAEDVTVRILTTSTPAPLSYTQELLVANFASYSDWGRDYLQKNEDRIGGDPLGSDILIRRIEAGETVPLAIEVPLAMSGYLELRSLFLVVDPDQNDNLLYKRSYDFIAAR